MEVIFTDKEIYNLGLNPQKGLFLEVMAYRVKEKAGLREIPRLLKYVYNPLLFRHEFLIRSND